MTTLHAQVTGDTLFYIDDLAMGGRYTVRGFDGEKMLAFAGTPAYKPAALDTARVTLGCQVMAQL